MAISDHAASKQHHFKTMPKMDRLPKDCCFQTTSVSSYLVLSQGHMFPYVSICFPYVPKFPIYFPYVLYFSPIFFMFPLIFLVWFIFSEVFRILCSPTKTPHVFQPFPGSRRPLILFGHSRGAAPATSVAYRQPERVKLSGRVI